MRRFDQDSFNTDMIFNSQVRIVLAGQPLSVTCRTMLTQEQEDELLRRAQNGDSDAADAVFICCSRLMMSYVRDYQNGNCLMSADDLFQEACTGLQTAINKYESGHGARFSTYASFWIRERLGNYNENNGSDTRIPRYLLPARKKILEYISFYKETNGCEPSVRKIAEALDLDVRTVHNLLCASNKHLRLDMEVGEDGTPLIDILDCNSDSFIDDIETEVRNQALLRAVNEVLNDRERFVIISRFGLFGQKILPLVEIGRILCISSERVRQIQNAALKKLGSNPDVRDAA